MILNQGYFFQVSFDFKFSQVKRRCPPLFRLRKSRLIPNFFAQAEAIVF